MDTYIHAYKYHGLYQIIRFFLMIYQICWFEIDITGIPFLYSWIWNCCCYLNCEQYAIELKCIYKRCVLYNMCTSVITKIFREYNELNWFKNHEIAAVSTKIISSMFSDHRQIKKNLLWKNDDIVHAIIYHAWFLLFIWMFENYFAFYAIIKTVVPDYIGRRQLNDLI